MKAPRSRKASVAKSSKRAGGAGIGKRIKRDAIVKAAKVDAMKRYSSGVDRDGEGHDEDDEFKEEGEGEGEERGKGGKEANGEASDVKKVHLPRPGKCVHCGLMTVS